MLTTGRKAEQQEMGRMGLVWFGMRERGKLPFGGLERQPPLPTKLLLIVHGDHHRKVKTRNAIK